jgi:DNA-binding LytR/AlgR family response regulator
MRILIIEDEKLAALELEEMIIALDNTLVIVDKLDSVKSAVKWLTHNSCDLIFLDIHLADGNGFEIFEQLEVLTPVIFTTAFDQYAIQAFSINSIDYLLKPIETEKLVAALNKFNGQKQFINSELAKLLEQYKTGENQFPKRFMVHSGELMLAISTSDIAYFFAHQRYVILCTFKNEQYVIDYTLDKLEQLLNPNKFFRINRQFIIGQQTILGMMPYTKGRVKLITNPPIKEEVIVSVDRSPKFKSWMNK